MSNSACKARRIANRGLKIKNRNVYVTVVVDTTDFQRLSVKVPVVGAFTVIDSNGTKRLIERSGTYHNTVKHGIARLGIAPSTVVAARIDFVGL